MLITTNQITYLLHLITILVTKLKYSLFSAKNAIVHDKVRFIVTIFA